MYERYNNIIIISYNLLQICNFLSCRNYYKMRSRNRDRANFMPTVERSKENYSIIAGRGTCEPSFIVDFSKIVGGPFPVFSQENVGAASAGAPARTPQYTRGWYGRDRVIMHVSTLDVTTVRYFPEEPICSAPCRRNNCPSVCLKSPARRPPRGTINSAS